MFHSAVVFDRLCYFILELKLVHIRLHKVAQHLCTIVLPVQDIFLIMSTTVPGHRNICHFQKKYFLYELSLVFNKLEHSLH